MQVMSLLKTEVQKQVEKHYEKSDVDTKAIVLSRLDGIVLKNNCITRKKIIS